MFHSVGIPLVHSWLYIAGTCMIYLLLLPKLKLGDNHRQTLFMCIGALMLALYLSMEISSPLLFALHIAPTCLLIAMLLRGYVARMAIMVIIASSGILFMDIDWVAMASSCAALTVLALIVGKRVYWESRWRLFLISALFAGLYLCLFAMIDTNRRGDLFRLPAIELALIIGAALLSSQLIPLLYLFIKNQARLHRELILSEKYQSIGQLAASISHEIRNPLTTARGFLQLMNMDKLTKENFERYRKYAFEGLDHANNIITEYLNFSKPSLEIAKPLDVKHEIESVVQWLLPYSVQLKVSIVTHHMSDITPHIKAEPKQFQQCMLNIMKNAIESMSDGGLLTVHTRIVRGQVQILIRDTGIGMSNEQLKRIGKPYFSTKESGTGLGLMVVMSLVKDMNGKILFRSKPNQGTICEIHLQHIVPEH